MNIYVFTLMVVAVVAFCVFFFLPSSGVVTEEFNCQAYCPGDGSLGLDSKLYLVKDPTQDVAVLAYNDKIAQYVIPAKKGDLLKNVENTLRTVYQDAAFLANAKLQEGDMPVGVVKKGDAALFVREKDISKGNNTNTGGALYAYYKYYQCAKNPPVHDYAAYYLAKQNNVAVLDASSDAHTGLVLQKLTGTLPLADVKLIANGLPDCSGFTCTLAYDYKTTPSSVPDSAKNVRDVKLRSVAYEYKNMPVAIDAANDQIKDFSENLRPAEGAFVAFEKSRTLRTSNDLMLSPLLRNLKDGISLNLSQSSSSPTVDGRRRTNVPESGRKKCVDASSRDCCIQLKDVAAITGDFDQELPAVEPIGSDEYEKGLGSFTCPYYIDHSLQGNVYKRLRQNGTNEGNCCLYAPSQGEYCKNSLPVTDAMMYEGEHVQDMECKRASEGGDFFQDGCNKRCEKMSKGLFTWPDGTKSREVFKYDGANQKVYPKLFRRDLGRCVYEEDKCALPTQEACLQNGAEFNAACDSVCSRKCDGFAEAGSNVAFLQQYEDNGMCTMDGQVMYEKQGSLLENYNRQLSSKMTAAFGGTGSSHTKPFYYGNATDTLEELYVDAEDGKYYLRHHNAVNTLTGAAMKADVDKSFEISNYNDILNLVAFRDANDRQYTVLMKMVAS
jgi:hypothetical protein